MRILIVAPRYHMNLYYRVKALQEAGHEVFLFTLYKQVSEKYDILEPIILKESKINNFLAKFHNNPESRFWKIRMYFLNKRYFKQKMKKINPDVVIIKNLQSILSLTALWYAKKFTNKVFLLIQTNKHYIKNKAKRFLMYILKKFFKVRAVITPLRNKLSKKDDFFKYIPFIFEVKDFEKKYFEGGSINIFDIGKFYKRKDHLLLLKVVNRLKDKYNIKLTIVGETGEKQVKKEIIDFIDENNLKDVVLVRENVPYSEILEMFKKQDLFVLPSYNEPAACSIVEAMANKLPVVVSDTCGTKCYIKEGKNGYIFKSGDLNDLEKKVEDIIKSREKLVKMGNENFKEISLNHSFDFFQKKIKEVFYE